ELPYRAHLSRKPDLPDDDRPRIDQSILQRRRDGGCDGKIGARFRDAQSANRIRVNVLFRKIESDAFLQNGNQKLQSSLIEAVCASPRTSIDALRGERLDFDENRTAPFEGDRHGRASGIERASLQESLRRVP